MNKNLLCLKWNEFNSFYLNGLSNLYQKDDMSDTTLFCDGRSFKAHKIILSIWSSYFREIFTQASHHNPVVVLRETTSADLELILRFIYQGQLFIASEDTDRFLKTAEYFQIAGLREMRQHLCVERTSSDIAAIKMVESHSHVTAPVNMINGIPSQYSSPSTSYTTIHSGNTSIDGIPVQILSTSPAHGEHSNTGHSMPISIVTSNTSYAAQQHQHQFSTNVIKPIPSRQPTRLHQPLLSPNSSSNYPHNVASTSSSRQEIVYSNHHPILIVQNQQKSMDYHEPNPSNNKGMNVRPNEHVLVFERGTSNSVPIMESRKLSQKEHPPPHGVNESIMNSYHIQQTTDTDEVLGLAYLHDSSSPRHVSQSHVIQEATIAADVSPSRNEETEVIELNRNSFTYADSHFGKSSKSSVVLTPQTSTPVYAVKRAVHSVPITSSSDVTTAGCSKTAKSGLKTKPPKTKRQRRVTPQNSDVEFVNCPKCDKRVKKTSLKVHIKRTHLEEGTVLTCPICSKQVSSKGVYYKHMFGHRQSVKSEHNTGKSTKPNSTAKFKESLTST